MSILQFSARIIPTNSSIVSSDTFDIIADIFDGTGVFSGFDIAVGDIVFLDSFPSMSSPNTISRYVVTQINISGATEVDIRIKWDDVGTIVDPSEILGTQGFITRATINNNLALHAAPTLHNFPDYVVQLSRNIDNTNIVDPLFRKLVKNETGSTISALKVLAWLDNGTVGLADADIHSLSDICGINPKAIPDGEFGWIVKIGYISNALVGLNAVPGDQIFLGSTPGQMTLTAPTGIANIIKIGRAEPPSGVVSAIANDLHMELEILSEVI